MLNNIKNCNRLIMIKINNFKNFNKYLNKYKMKISNINF